MNQPPDPAVRKVLEGIPRVGFYQGGPRAPQDDLLPASIAAFLEWRGEDLGFRQATGKADPWHDVHIYLMGTSGQAFRTLWNPGKWDFGSLAPLAASEDALLPVRAAMESAGYGCEVLLRKSFADELGVKADADPDEATFRRRIVESIRDKGRPVIAFGVIGPPEACLITGYDEGGAVLIGWNGFQGDKNFAAGVEFEKSGCFRKRDWFAATQGLILIGEKQARPPVRETYRRSLRWGVEMMRTPVVRGRAAGQAAYTVWADTLLKNALFDKKELPALKESHDFHHSAAGTLAEARAWGANFLRFAADQAPEAANALLDAASCFDAEHDLVWAMWEFTSGMMVTEEGAQRFANAGTRGRIVPLIRLARKQDAEAAAHIEKALALMDEADRKAVTRAEMPAQSPGGTPRRAVLAGVPKIGYNVHLCPFPGSLFAVMQYLGDPCDYDYLMGVTGAAFRRLWNRDDGGNVDLSYLAPEPYRRAATALGYELRVLGHGDKEQMKRALRESIAKGRPVLAFGIVGPPECGILAGYDRGGDVAIGTSYFQDEKVPGYYEKADWFEKAEWAGDTGFLLVGDKNRWPGPSRRDLLISTLRWAIDLERTPRRSNLPNHVSGLAAYEAWAKGLETDADYPKEDAKVLGTRAMVHQDQVAMLYERHNAARFLRAMAGDVPEVAEPLKGAADLYDQVANHCEHLWFWGHWAQPQAQQGIADATMRRKMAEQVRAAAAKEARAVELLEMALKALTGG